MKKCMLLSVTFAICFLISNSAFAKKDELPNGKPFQILQSEIEANSAAIEANSNNISLLQGQLDSLRSDFDTLNLDFDAIIDRVVDNETGITNLTSQVTDLSSLSGTLESELAALKQQHNNEIAAIEIDILSIKEDIALLQQTASDLATDLSNSVSELSGAIGDNTASITTLAAVAVVQADLTAINTAISSLNSLILELQNELDSQTLALENINFRIAALERVVFSAILTEVTFEVANTQCYRPADDHVFTWSINGTVVATSQGDTNLTCSCNSTNITTVTVNDPAILENIIIADDGSNTISFERTTTGNGTAFVFTRATLTFINGESAAYCVYDINGGDCTDPKPCTAGYTFYATSGEINF